MIKVENLFFTYPGNKEETIKGLNFEIEDGEIFGFLGPNGSGKSTTQKIITGLLKKYKGEINILSRDLKEWKSDLYEQIGVSFELPNLYQKLTGLENLNFFRSLYNGKTIDANDLLKMVDLEKAGNTKIMHYSKGMKMRLTFARSLLNYPKIIFMDEPTSGLDPVNARLIKDIIKDLKNQGRTIFLTTHNMTDADELCDRVAFIVEGQIKLIDSPRELKIRKGRKKVKIEYHLNNHVKAIEFPLNNIGQNQDFIRMLQSQKIETIHTQEATLEDIFIESTGRRLL